MLIDFAALQRILQQGKDDRSTPQLLQFQLQTLIDQGFADLPLPGRGDTLNRWRALALVAARDLGLAKLYEGHCDALAILAELDSPAPTPGGRWGVWAAEPPQARLRCRLDTAGQVWLEGRKAWCSGAAQLSHALVSAWDEADQPCLVAVELAQPEVEITHEGWHAVGMAATVSVDVLFHRAAGRRVGAPGAYLRRAGFWQGGAGIAACWYGAAGALAESLRQRCRSHPEPHAMAHLGAVDAALSAASAQLRETAAWIDAQPQADAQLVAGRARAVVENAVESVLRHVGRALGAAPFCRDAHFAALAADLPVFVRQSHAERDLAGLAERIVEETSPWAL